MWQRFSFYDFRVIGHYLGVLLFFTGLMMLIPLSVALALGEYEPAQRYLMSMGIGICVGSLLRMLRIAPGKLSRQQAVAVTSFAWLVVGFMAAVPLALSSHYASVLDAVFDAVSLVTTTGVSIASNPDHISYADNMWRFSLSYAGGLGLIVVAMSFGLFGPSSGHPSLYESEGRSEHVLPNVVQTAQFILKFSSSIVGLAAIVLAIVLALHGVDPLRSAFHGLWLAITSFMTTGLTPQSLGVAYYHSVGIEFVLMILMVLGSINFGLQSEVLRGRVKAFMRDIEVHAGVAWVAGTLIVFICALAGSELMNNLPAMMRTGLFTLIAASTTCGLSVVSSNQLTTVFPSGALLVLALAMAVGGSSGSTAGGIKLRRIAIIGKSAFETMKSTASPESARIVTNYYHIGRHRLDGPEVKEAMTVFIMFVAVYIIGALAGIAMGYDAVAAVSESVAMASNGGISSGIADSSAPVLLKIIYIAEMWAGRLEFVTFLAVFIKIFASVRPRRTWIKRED
ncbi:TrkH family potassium uptake protein [Curtanaerobium respiraculi]|uniref:TrkH family potassium uptake protein n=1 Tax=Curtanaerobium respiraculi TaxID=2949669 RepID=UPI0024B38A5E|nr:potassium transporter TrkG [Curtanaerobium respiraculi]